MNWVDYGIIAILAFGIINGYRKGLIMSVSSIVCLLISIIVAKTYYKPLTVFLVENTPIAEKITGFLSEKAFVKNLLMNPSGESTVFSISKTFSSDLNAFVTVLIINAISVLIIFLAVRLLLAFAEGLLSGVVGMPGLREVNGLGGAAVGLAKNIIIIMLILTIITPVSAVKPLNGIAGGLEASTLAKYFYNYNFILGWIWSAALDLIK